MIVDSKNIKKRKRGYLKNTLNTHYYNYCKSFGIWLERLGYASTTVIIYKRNLSRFFKYLQEQQITTIYSITQQHLQDYNQVLHLEPITPTYIQSQFKSIKTFSSYLEKTEHYKLSFKDIIVVKGLTIERTILTQKEVQHLFDSLENTAKGALQNALLHLLYSCGLRSNEAVNIKVKDIDYHKQLIHVCPGKNYHSRYVPISTGVAKDLQLYEQYARGILNPNGKYFLVSSYTNEMNTAINYRVLKHIIAKSGINKTISPHGLRHSIATHLLHQGMALESIQQFLGHQSLEATEIYVRMSYEYLP